MDNLALRFIRWGTGLLVLFPWVVLRSTAYRRPGMDPGVGTSQEP